MRENVGKSLLELVSDSFCDIGFALMSKDEDALKRAQVQLNTARVIAEKHWDSDAWKKIEHYFGRYGGPVDSTGLTLKKVIETFSAANPQSELVVRELCLISGKVAVRVQNIEIWIRDDAERAAEPFLSLLR